MNPQEQNKAAAPGLQKNESPKPPLAAPAVTNVLPGASDKNSKAFDKNGKDTTECGTSKDSCGTK